MIALLRGLVAEREKQGLIVDVQGVGYRVAVASTVREKYQVGEEVKLRIYHHITDSDQVLFGFASQEELAYFELLLKVPSVGPKTAMGILEAAPAQLLARAVIDNDLSLLTSIAGVGKRTAGRILVELKDKIAHIAPTAGGERGPSILAHETSEALVGLGYSVRRAQEAVRQLPSEVGTVEEAVKFILQRHRA